MIRPGISARPQPMFATVPGPASAAACFGVMAILLASCISQPSSAPATTYVAWPSPSPLQVVTPTQPSPLQVSDLTWRVDKQSGTLKVLGLVTNHATQPLGDITLSVSLRDEDGSLIAEAHTRAARSNLSPGEGSYFLALFPAARIPAQVQAQPASFSEPSSWPPRAEMKTPIVVRQRDGSGTILGWLENMETATIRVSGLTAFLTDPLGRPLDAAEDWLAQSVLPPDGSTPFRIRLPEAWDPDHIIVEADLEFARDAGRPIDVRIEVADSRASQQGLPFYLVTLTNQSQEPWWVRGLLLIERETEPLAVLPIQPPVPLLAGNAWSYAVDPALALPLMKAPPADWMPEIRIRAFPDPLESRPAVLAAVQVPVAITGYELIGRMLHLRGLVENRSETPLKAPTVWAHVIATDGRLLTAGFAQAAESMEAWDAAPFHLALPVPLGFDPAAAEYDIQAYALRP